MKSKNNGLLKIKVFRWCIWKKAQLNRVLFCFLILTLSKSGHSQVYTEKQTRHRFAQLNLGLDFQGYFGGSSKYIDGQGNTKAINLTNHFLPRIIIGGTHFWGHADFQIAIPLYSPTIHRDNQEITARKSVETAFKYYPFRIRNNKVRTYIGTSFAPYTFAHRNNYLKYSNGPELNYTSFPLLFGLTLNTKNHLIEFGLSWNYQFRYDYFISRTQIEQINTNRFQAGISYKYMLETTLSAEKDWESGRTKKVTDILAERGKLNGIYAGIGISSAFWLKQSEYNKTNRPFIRRYSPSTMPDLSIGYYFHKPDLNLAIGYRGYGTSTDTYGVIQHMKRRSLLIETTKFLFDYHGFVPFLGPTLSYEDLSFKEVYEDQMTFNIKEKKMGYGLTFGWDIRPNRVQAWILRTNLRWYPNLSFRIEQNTKVFFDALEFNFIQLIIYPSRMIKGKPKQGPSDS